MDYQKIYNQIIERAKNRMLEGYKEKHHVIPKCLGGNNDRKNIVELTAREHFLCHMLLHEMYPQNVKLIKALWLMSINKNKKPHQRYKISSRTYELLKIKYSNIVKGKKDSLETRQKKSIALKKRIMDWESRNLKASEKLKNRKITWNLKGIPRKPHNRKTNIAIMQFDLNGNFIKEYSSIAEAAGKNRALHESIRCCIHGKYNTANGYIWKKKQFVEKLKQTLSGK
jgi:hypothetical protein